MKTLTLVVCMLFCGSVYGSETPQYLTPPTQSEHVVAKVMYLGFVASSVAALTLGLVAVSKSKSQSTAANRLLAASFVCDGAAGAFLVGTAITF